MLELALVMDEKKHNTNVRVAMVVGIAQRTFGT